MNMLPTTLIVATLLSGGIFTQSSSLPLDSASLQQSTKNCIQTQVMIGSICNSKIVLDKLCINLEGILNGCFRPSTPEIEVPDVAVPDIEVPDFDTPDIDAPDVDMPDIEIPDSKPEFVPPVNNTPNVTPDPDVPEIESPDIEVSGDNTENPYIARVVELVNEERAKVNLPALTMSKSLNNAAQIRAVETTQSFSHTRPNGKSFSSVLSENNITFRGAGENIAWGQKSPETVVNAWMNSSGHRANILNKKFTTIGVGYYLNGSTPYWCQLFTY